MSMRRLDVTELTSQDSHLENQRPAPSALLSHCFPFSLTFSLPHGHQNGIFVSSPGFKCHLVLSTWLMWNFFCHLFCRRFCFVF